MSVNGKFKGFTDADLLAEALRFGVGSAAKVLAEVRAAVQGWSGFASRAGVSSAQSLSIEKQLLLLRP